MFIKPEDVLKKIGIEKGSVVADFGAGAGHYVIPAARMVGDRSGGGRVYALDIQKNLLEKIKTAAEESGLGTVEIIWADLEKEKGSKLAEDIADLVIVSDLLFQIEIDSRANVLGEARRILKPNGRLALIDWADGTAGIGPSGMGKMAKNEAEQTAIRAGFKFEREFEAGDHHYGLLFRL